MSRPDRSHPGIARIVLSANEPIKVHPRFCVTGGRDLKDRHMIEDALALHHEEQAIAELAAGCATGADEFALEWADRVGVPWRKYCADWNRFEQEAGLIRNEVMLMDFQPERLLVFPGGTGTTHCTRTARKMKIKRHFFGLNDDPLLEAAKWG